MKRVLHGKKRKCIGPLSLCFKVMLACMHLCVYFSIVRSTGRTRTRGHGPWVVVRFCSALIAHLVLACIF
jgi:hypothetical protein